MKQRPGQVPGRGVGPKDCSYDAASINYLYRTYRLAMCLFHANDQTVVVVGEHGNADHNNPKLQLKKD